MNMPLPAYPLLVQSSQAWVKSGALTWRRPLLMLFSRIVLFAAWQTLFALAFALSGAPSPWQAAAAWWPISATFTNLISLALLIRLFKSEGQSYARLWAVNRATLKSDALVMLAILLLSGPVAFLPNIAAASWLFGNQTTAVELMFRPLPYPVALAAFVIFPLTIGLAELPTYFGYVLPRLEALTGRGWWALSLSALMLAAQHIALPLLFDGRFMLYRLLMFLPFAVMLGIVLRWRPRLFPFFMIFHALIDFATMYYVLAVAVH